MRTSVFMEPLLGYHPYGTGFLTCTHELGGGQCLAGSLTVTPTGGTGTKVGLSDPVVRKWDCHRSTDKSYPGDNRLILPKSSHRRKGLAPRCRLITSWGCSRSQGLGCSPIKVVRELGSERRETVRSLSGAGVRCLKGAVLSTRGPGWTDRWCICCVARRIRQGSQVRQG